MIDESQCDEITGRIEGCLKTMYGRFMDHLDENGSILPFPKDVNLKEIMKKLPATTTTVLTSEKVYQDYSIDELRKL